MQAGSTTQSEQPSEIKEVIIRKKITPIIDDDSNIENYIPNLNLNPFRALGEAEKQRASQQKAFNLLIQQQTTINESEHTAGIINDRFEINNPNTEQNDQQMDINTGEISEERVGTPKFNTADPNMTGGGLDSRATTSSNAEQQHVHRNMFSPTPLRRNSE